MLSDAGAVFLHSPCKILLMTGCQEQCPPYVTEHLGTVKDVNIIIGNLELRQNSLACGSPRLLHLIAGRYLQSGLIDRRSNWQSGKKGNAV